VKNGMLHHLCVVGVVLFLNNVMYARPTLVVLSGGPGAGKTTIINKLAQMGYDTVSESPTEVIKDEQAHGNPRPWEKFVEFQQRILDLQVQKLSLISKKDGYIFCDRGTADGLAYYLHKKMTPSDLYVQTIKNNPADIVFLVDYPPSNYSADIVRHEDVSEALELHEYIRQVYEDNLGYRIFRVNQASVDERVAFILNSLGLKIANNEEGVCISAEQCAGLK
jgi:predicted ATPase